MCTMVAVFRSVIGRKCSIAVGVCGFLCLICLSFDSLGAQVVVNDYYVVTEAFGCDNVIDVSASIGDIVADDRILVIQNKGGAVFSTGDSFNPSDKQSGPIRTYNSTGHFEVATVTWANTSGAGTLRLVLDRDLCFSYEAGEYPAEITSGVFTDFPNWGQSSNGEEYVHGAQVIKIPRDDGSRTSLRTSPWT